VFLSSQKHSNLCNCLRLFVGLYAVIGAVSGLENLDVFALTSESKSKRPYKYEDQDLIQVGFHLVSGFVFRDSGFGFKASGFGFRVQSLGSRIQRFGFRVQSCGFRIQRFGFRVQSFGFRDRVRGVWFRVQGVGLGGWNVGVMV